MTIHGWVKQVEIDDGDCNDGLTSKECIELRRLRQEVKQLRQERDILSKAAAWFAQHNVTSRGGGNSHCRRSPSVRSVSTNSVQTNRTTSDFWLQVTNDGIH